MNKKTNKTIICCLQRNSLYNVIVKGWEKIYLANSNQKKAGVAILISDKVDFRVSKITMDKEGHFIMIKGSIHQEGNTPKSVCT